jgi:hypothetical protein
MATRNTLFQKPTVEIDQDRYEELIRHEMQYEQYRQQADEPIRSIIETNIDVKLIDESEEK